MTLYTRFLITLAAGLSGLTLVLILLMDRLFLEWDMFADLSAWWQGLSHHGYRIRQRRAEDAEDAVAQPETAGRYLKPEKHSAQVDPVPTVLHAPGGPITLTPLPRSLVTPPQTVR